MSHLYQGATDNVLIFHKSLPDEWHRRRCKSAQIILLSLQQLPVTRYKLSLNEQRFVSRGRKQVGKLAVVLWRGGEDPEEPALPARCNLFFGLEGGM